MKSAQQLYDEGDALFQKGKFRDAAKIFDQVIGLDNKFMPAYRGQFRCYNALGEYKTMSDWCDKALAVDPTYQYGLNSKGNSLHSMGRTEEAIKYFDKAIELYPNWDFPYNGKGNCMRSLGRYKEAVESYKKNLELTPNDTTALRNLAISLHETGRYEEAKEAYDKAIALDPDNAQYLCDRGTLFNRLGKREEALQDFRKAHKSIQNGFLDVNLEPAHMEYIKWTLKSVVELDDISAQAEAAVQKADKNNPVVKKFLANIVKLQEEKDKVTGDLMTKVGKNDTSGSNELVSELEKLKSQFAEIQSQLNKVQSDVKEMKSQLEDVKEELDNKMDNFNKKLENELAKMDLTPDDQTKVKEYYRAFIETFSSIHVTSQVVDSGQVQLDTDSTKATILSLVASFTPFVGSVLSSGIKSLSGFLQSKEMKTSARKMKGLAADATELSQLIGKSGYEIVMNKEKRGQIIAITNADLKATSDSIVEKITQFCDNLSEELDAFLYSRLYKTPSARLGHNDANELVELWIKGKISHYAIEEEFVKNATDLNKKKQEEPEENVSPSQANRTSCCNLF